MTIQREAIFAALFRLVSGAPGLVTTSRKLRHWSDVPQSERPALFQTQGDQVSLRDTGQPTRWLLTAKLYIYVSTFGENSSGEVLNPILDYLTQQLGDPFPGVSQSLGGLCEYARIEGTIVTDEGTLGDDAVAVVPVMILAT